MSLDMVRINWNTIIRTDISNQLSTRNKLCISWMPIFHKVTREVNTNSMIILSYTMSTYCPVRTTLFYCTIFTNNVMIPNTSPTICLMPLIDFDSIRIAIISISGMMNNYLICRSSILKTIIIIIQTLVYYINSFHLYSTLHSIPGLLFQVIYL